MQPRTELSTSAALLDMLGTLATADRANFWHIYANTGFPSLSEPLAEAVQLAAGVELLASQSGEASSFLAENETLRLASKARIGAIESLRGNTTFARTSHQRPTDEASALEYDCGHAIVAMIDRDFEKAVNIFDSIDVSALEHPSMRLLYGYALCQLQRWVEGNNLVVGSIESLRRNSFGAANSGFWRAFSMIGDGDPEFTALVSKTFAENIPNGLVEEWAVITQGLAAQALVYAVPTIESLQTSLDATEMLLKSPEAAVAMSFHRWLATARTTVSIYERMQSLEHEPSEETGRNLARARRNLARLEFSSGNEPAALDLLKLAYIGDGDARDIRVLRMPKTSQLPSIPSVRDFRAGEAYEIPPSPITRVDGAAVRPTLDSTMRWVATVADADIVAGDRIGSVFWYVKTRDDWLLADGLNVHPRYQLGSANERLTAVSPSGRVLYNAEKRAPTIVPGHSILLGGVANYYHWLMEYLPKLAVLENLAPDMVKTTSNWIVNADITTWQTESLSLLGVPSDRIRPTPAGAPVRAMSLTVPSMTTAREATAFLRSKLDADRPALPDRKLYVSRLDTSPDRRRIHAEETLVVQLQQAGYEIILPSEMSFLDQVEAFANASVVVGPHGAGLTNIAFVPKDSTVVEITNSHNHTYNFFSDIAEAVGCQYSRYSGGQEVANEREPENASSLIDAGSLLAYIENQERIRRVCGDQEFGA